MALNMYTQQFIQNYLNSYNELTFNGVDCVFIPINEKHGIKLYLSEIVRDRSFRRQKTVYTHNPNLAPEVIGEMFQATYNGQSYYGYVTEILPVVINPKSTIGKSNDEYRAWKDKIYQYDYIYKDKMCDTLDAIKAILGYRLNDNYICNFGFRDGNLALIDFGD